jgi:hypothetical protein
VADYSSVNYTEQNNFRNGAVMTQKFDNLDRGRVIREIEKALKVNLSRVGSRPKELVDEAGKLYWVLGGSGDWHGIPPEMLDRAKANLDSGKIFIAKKLPREVMRIYIGSIAPFVEGVGRLTKTKNGEFQFDQDIKRGELLIKQLPKARFEFLGEISYPDAEKVGDRKKIDISRTVEKLSREEKEALIEALNGKNLK